MSISLDKIDNTYRTGHAHVLLSGGYPKSFTIPLAPEDTTAPVFSVQAKPAEIWPPTGKLVHIAVSVVMKDDYDPQPEIKLESITANEPLGAGDITGAEFGKDDRQFNLAAKREGANKAGRIYTITYSATDASGNRATATTTVTVPHDQGKK
jgi:hypothetical protein